MSPAAETVVGRRAALMLVAAPAVSLLATPTTTYAAEQLSTRTSSSVAPPRLAWVVGDSITVLGRSALRERLASSVRKVEVDAVEGRPVAVLDDLVKARLARRDPPDVMVLALGTNPSPGWRRDDFERMVDRIPAGTAVIFVTVYRSRGSCLPRTLRTMGSYSRWMRDLAAQRDNVGVAQWRDTASDQRARLLADGVHPTVRGTQVWARLICDAVDSAAPRTHTRSN